MREEKFCINCQLRNKLFFIVIHRFSLVKAMMNALRIWKKCAMALKNASISSFSNCQRRNNDHCILVKKIGEGLSFQSLDGRIYESKLRNEKKKSAMNFLRRHLNWLPKGN
jgi:hypothetical protein